MYTIVLTILLLSPQEVFQRLSSIKSWRGEFYQEVSEKGLGVLERKSGVVFFKRPLNILFIYEDNSKFLCDGINLWEYNPVKDETFIRPLTEYFSENIISKIMAGDSAVLKILNLKKNIENKKGGIFEFGMDEIIKNSTVKVYYRKEGFPIKEISIESEIGTRFKIEFKKIDIRDLPDKIFKLWLGKANR